LSRPKPPAAQGIDAAAGVLTERDVVDLLISRRLLSIASIVDGDLAIHDLSRRHVSFGVVSDSGPSYFVKLQQPHGTDAIAREAAFYTAIQPRRAARHLPVFYDYDPGFGALVLEFVEGARSLADHHARGRFSTRVARAMGRVLAELHCEAVIGCDAIRPYGLAVHRPAVSWLREMSEANVQLVKRIQAAPGVCAVLNEVAADWSEESIIHGDLRAANWMVQRNPRGRATGLRLIDWENAGLGDPAWDVGSVFGDYLSSWLGSIPIVAIDRLDRLPELARFPLVNIRPAVLAFWETYVTAGRIGAHAADRMVVRAARYAGARLMQTAVERTQFSTSVTGLALCMAQAAANVLRRPEEAAVRLLGISLRGGRE
jgi:aminoglycoside phosphotransferase (APT) family kinase protein